MTANRCKDCGHTRGYHGTTDDNFRGDRSCHYRDCPCRVFVPDDRPATITPEGSRRPCRGGHERIVLGCAYCGERIYSGALALRAERDELQRHVIEQDKYREQVTKERDELRAALEECRSLSRSMEFGRPITDLVDASLTKGSNDE